jgi:hypothetical protein
MTSRFADLKKQLYRNIKYRIARPKPPTLAQRFAGPVVVVGSAPVSHKPAGFNDSFSVITINGSQSVTQGWGVDVPDVTLIQFNQIEGTNTNAVEVRRVLRGQRTRMLYILLWRDGFDRLVNGLKAFDYGYDKMEIVNRYQRMALLDRVGGLKKAELDADSKCSNGINAVLLALYNGATEVIITGINPDSGGHAYNQENLARMHVQMDRQILLGLMKKGYPVYTADPAVSESLGLPLWKGKESASARIPVSAKA